MSKVVELSVVVPAFREAKTIQESILRLNEILEKSKKTFEIIVVIDGIVDNTREILDGLNISNLRILSYSRNVGKGFATRMGLEHSVGTEYLAYIDADLDLHPDSILIGLDILDSGRHITGAVGSKLHVNSSVTYPRSRRVQSKLFKAFVQALFQLGLSDTQTGLKIFRTQPLRAAMGNLKSDGFAFDLEILVALKKQRAVFVEIPVILDYQFSSSVTLKGAIASVRDVLSIYFR